MNITIETNNHTIASIEGRIDTLTAPELETKILPLITEQNATLEFDCTKVDYISSSGLRVFLLADKAAQKNGGIIILSNLNDYLKEIFDISGLTDLFEFR